MISSMFLKNFIAIHEFKLELLSGNARFGLRSSIFFGPCDLEISQITTKTKGLLYSVTLNFVHFVAICEFKLELQSGNAQFESKSPIMGHLSYGTPSFVHQFGSICEFKLEL